MADETTADKAETAASDGAATKNGGAASKRASKAAKESKRTKNNKAAKASTNGKAKGSPKSKGAGKKPSGKPTRKAKIAIASEDLPRRTLSECLPLTESLRAFPNKTATWEEIAQALGVTSTNNRQKYPLWSGVAYGLIKQDGDQYTLAEVGRKIIAPEYNGEDQEGKLKAILTPRVLAQFYSDYNNGPLPAETNLVNVLENRYSIPRDRVQEALHILLTNAREVGILRPGVGGNEVFQFSPTDAPPKPQGAAVLDGEQAASGSPVPDGLPRVQSEICFVITPIGDEGSKERQHADAVLKHLIEPVLGEVKLGVLRADKISKPGIINKQIVAQLAYSKLCIADLSFNNPNAFYEMGVRHAFKLPMIQIIRKGDKIPFDVGAGRTIQIDCSDPYGILDAVTSARKELKEHVEAVLQGKVSSDDEPMTLYLPGLKVTIPPLAGA